MGHVRGLVCRQCGHAGPEALEHVCERCLGPLEIDYDWGAIRRAARRDAIAAGPASLWRYAALLPVEAGPAVAASAHTGLTPLVRARRLAGALGLRELYLKDEGACYPTGSFKDRLVAVALARAAALGLDTVACASTGNLAAALAAGAARSGLRAVILVPVGLEPAKLVGVAIHGATVVAVEGGYDDAQRLASEAVDRHRWGFVNVNLRPYYVDAAKTVGYEIAEQLGWRAPAHVVVPCAGGALLCAIARALRELVDLALIEPGHTRLHAAQPGGAAPIVDAVRQGAPVRPVRPRTACTSLAIGNPADGDHAASVVRGSDGWAAAPTDAEAIDAVGLLARTEGIFTEMAGGVTLAALRRLVDEGRIPPDEPVVVCLTGGGLRTAETMVASLVPPPRIGARLELLDQVLADLVTTTDC